MSRNYHFFNEKITSPLKFELRTLALNKYSFKSIVRAFSKPRFGGSVLGLILSDGGI